MILTPLVIAQLFSIGAKFGSQIAKMTGNDEVAQKLGIASMVSGTVSSAGNTLKDAFTTPNTSTSTTSDSVSDFTKSLTIDTPGGGVDQVLNRNITQGLFGNTGNKNIASIYDPFQVDFFSRSA